MTFHSRIRAAGVVLATLSTSVGAQDTPTLPQVVVTARVDSTAQIAGEQQYTVQKGDSLSRIAKHLLGDANAWKQIFEANRDVLDNPDKIFPGQVLKIPAKDDSQD